MARARVSTESKIFMLRRAIKEMVPYKEAEYTNMVIADGIATGQSDKMTSDWLRKMLLFNMEDGMRYSYDQALTLNRIYNEVIPKLKAMV